MTEISKTSGKSGKGIVPPSRMSVCWAAVFAVMFVGVMASVVAGAAWVAPFDSSVGLAVADCRVWFLDWFFRSVSFIGKPVMAGAIMAVFVICLLLLKRRRSALFFCVVIAIGLAISFSIKYAVDRPRPVGMLLDATLVETDPSFPSGHTFTTTLMYSLIAMIVYVHIAKIKKHFWVQKLFVVLAIVLPVLMGFSRLYMGEHFPTDVMGGFLLALALTVLAGSTYFRNPAWWDCPTEVRP